MGAYSDQAQADHGACAALCDGARSEGGLGARPSRLLWIAGTPGWRPPQFPVMRTMRITCVAVRAVRARAEARTAFPSEPSPRKSST